MPSVHSFQLLKDPKTSRMPLNTRAEGKNSPGTHYVTALDHYYASAILLQLELPQHSATSSPHKLAEQDWPAMISMQSQHEASLKSSRIPEPCPCLLEALSWGKGTCKALPQEADLIAVRAATQAHTGTTESHGTEHGSMHNAPLRTGRTDLSSAHP